MRHPDLDDDFPLLRSLEAPWSNLPSQLAGKTRLALQVAADSLEDFPDGIRFLVLASVVDPQYIVDEIAAAVGVQAAPDIPLVETIGQKIGAQRMLLALDNNEHLVDDVARLVEQLLNTSSGVKILATSRERLNLSAEAAYRVPSLAMPDLSPARTSDHVSGDSGNASAR